MRDGASPRLTFCNQAPQFEDENIPVGESIGRTSQHVVQTTWGMQFSHRTYAVAGCWLEFDRVHHLDVKLLDVVDGTNRQAAFTRQCQTVWERTGVE